MLQSQNKLNILEGIIHLSMCVIIFSRVTNTALYWLQKKKHVLVK